MSVHVESDEIDARVREPVDDLKQGEPARMKHTPMYQRHLELGATMYTTGTGYALASRYSSADEEARAVRQRVGIIDLSLMTRLSIKGKDALRLTQKLIVNDAEKLKDGQALYSTMCNEQGLIVDDVVVFRFNAEHFWVITSSAYRRGTFAWISSHMQGVDASLTDVSSAYAMMGVQGPKSRELLSSISDIDFSKLGFFRFAEGHIGGAPCIVARLGFSGELGYEVYVNTEDGIDTWDKIMEAGKAVGLIPYGMDALDLLRLEKGFVFFGYDATERDNPYECRLWPFIKLDRGDFIGREALLKIRDAGPKKQLMGLKVAGNTVLTAGSPLHMNGGAAGTVVIGFRSPNLNENLAYAYVNAPSVQVGAVVSVEVAGEQVQATVVEMPFLDPEGTRLRG